MKTTGLMICFSLFVSLLTTAAFAQFDLQSADEIAQARERIQQDFSSAKLPASLSALQKIQILQSYNYVDPKEEVPKDLLKASLLYFDLNKAQFENQNYITVINYKPRSDNYRFFVIDMTTGTVEKYHTAHGWGSDKNIDGIATSFGNVNNSKKSSLGFAKTAATYSGKFLRSLRLDGLSTTNSNLRSRAIVVHGWDHIHEANEIPGVTQGCPALDWKIKDAVIDKIQNGSLVNMGYSLL